jgi:hypothetical protein
MVILKLFHRGGAETRSKKYCFVIAPQAQNIKGYSLRLCASAVNVFHV